MDYNKFFKIQLGQAPAQVLYDLRELTGFESGKTLQKYFMELLGRMSPSGYEVVSRKAILGILKRYPEQFASESVFFAACEEHYFRFDGGDITPSQAKELWQIVKLLRKPNAYAKFIREANLHE